MQPALQRVDPGHPGQHDRLRAGWWPAGWQVTLASGVSYKNYRCRPHHPQTVSRNFTKPAGTQNLPALFALEGENVFTFTRSGCDPRRPTTSRPYPASDDTDLEQLHGGGAGRPEQDESTSLLRPPSGGHFLWFPGGSLTPAPLESLHLIDQSPSPGSITQLDVISNLGDHHGSKVRGLSAENLPGA